MSVNSPTRAPNFAHKALTAGGRRVNEFQPDPAADSESDVRLLSDDSID